MSMLFKGAVAAVMMILGTVQALASDWQKVVSPAELKTLMTDDVLVLDIRPPKAFATGRIPGALNAPYGQWRGPRENPGRTLSDAALTKLLQGLGITPDSKVVVTYPGRSASGFGAAARVYWTLKSAGLTRRCSWNDVQAPSIVRFGQSSSSDSAPEILI